MSHDPMCPVGWEMCGHCDEYVTGCQCDLIVRVREDERTRVVCEFMSNHGDREMYAAALRDAVEAVKALPPITDAYPTSSPAGGEGLSIVTRTWLCNRDSAVAAIEALFDTPPRQAKEHINPTGYDPAATDNRP